MDAMVTGCDDKFLLAHVPLAHGTCLRLQGGGCEAGQGEGPHAQAASEPRLPTFQEPNPCQHILQDGPDPLYHAAKTSKLPPCLVPHDCTEKGMSKVQIHGKELDTGKDSIIQHTDHRCPSKNSQYATTQNVSIKQRSHAKTTNVCHQWNLVTGKGRRHAQTGMIPHNEKSLLT